MPPTVELTSGPQPDIALVGPHIPVLKSVVNEMSKPSRAWDYGDIQIAYYNIGLSAEPNRPAPPKPSQEQVQDYIRRLVWHASGPARHPGNSSSEGQRMRRVNCCLMAIRTLHQYKSQHLDITSRIDLRDADRARDVPNKAWEDLPDPIPDWDTLSAHIKNHRRALARKVLKYQPAGDLWLARRELEENSMKKYDELRRYLDACDATGFSATQWTGDVKLGVINFPEDGNSLWYCLGYGPSTGSGSRESWATIKYQIWDYFNHVLSHPDHPRHRLYVVLQQQSCLEIEARTPGSQRLWGRMSILRALYTNKPHSGPPMYCHFRGIYQVIADFFGMEVVVFTRPQPQQIEWPQLRNDPPRTYDWKAYGSSDHGLDRGQIMLVTDSTLEQHQIAKYFDGYPEQYFDTEASRADDRYGWIEAPWMRRPLADDYEPIPLPQHPVDSYQFTAGIGSSMWYEFFGSGNAVSNDSMNDYNQGMETIFPDPMQAGWVEEWPAPPFADPYPYPAGSNRVVTGVYTDPEGKETWPQWDNIKSYELYTFQQHAARAGLKLEPCDKSG